jgi:hypothetical protein
MIEMRLKWAILLAIGIAMVLLIPPIIARNPIQIGEAFPKAAVYGFVIILIGTWDEYQYEKKEKKEKERK